MLRRQLLSFAVIGVIGFIVDSSVLYLAIDVGLGLYFGRVLSYLVAVTTTWVLNRHFTFPGARSGNLPAEWARFALSQLSGAAANLLTYGVLVHLVGVVTRHPIIGVAAGSVSGLLFN